VSKIEELNEIYIPVKIKRNTLLYGMCSFPLSTNILYVKHLTPPSAYVKACKGKDREKTKVRINGGTILLPFNGKSLFQRSQHALPTVYI